MLVKCCLYFFLSFAGIIKALAANWLCALVFKVLVVICLVSKKLYGLIKQISQLKTKTSTLCNSGSVA